jgi:hypothetical protein
MGPIYNCANRSHSNILVLKCLGLVDSNRLMIDNQAYREIRVWPCHNALAKNSLEF